MTAFVIATQRVGVDLSWQLCPYRTTMKTGAAYRGDLTGAF